MYLTFLSSELKKWLRDPMMTFLLTYPLVFGFIGRYGLPWIGQTTGVSFEPFSDLVITILALVPPHIYGAVVGFSILDDRDDNVLTSVKVTPLDISGFLSFRIIIVTILAFLASTFIIWFSNLGGLTIGQILAVAFLSCFAAPMTAFLINAVASNKIEGFVAIKGVMSIFLIFPSIGLFFTDIKELFFAIIPGFWPAKVVSSFLRGDELLFLNLAQYYWIGLFYVLVLNVLAARLFIRRVHF